MGVGAGWSINANREQQLRYFMREVVAQPDFDVERIEECWRATHPNSSLVRDRVLEIYADMILEDDRNSHGGFRYDPHTWLNDHQIQNARRKEVMGASVHYPGYVDPSTTVNSRGQRGFYWRQAPEGRRVNSDENRHGPQGSGYFR